MRRWISIFLCVIMLFLTMPCMALGFFYDGEFHIYEGNPFRLRVNGALLTAEMPPIVFSGYSVVPVRSVFQDGLGAKVDWNSKTSQVTVMMDDTEIILFINNKMAYINGNSVKMPIAPKIIDGYTMVPARFVAEELGMQVEFDGTTDTISITAPKKETGITPEKKPTQEENKTPETLPSVSVLSVHWSDKSDETIGITIKTDVDKPSYNAFILENPVRLVVDVLGGTYVSQPNEMEVKRGNIQGIRFGQNEHARIVVDLSAYIGHSVTVQGSQIYISVAYDEALKEPETLDVMQEITYGYEGGRDFMRIELKHGKAVRNGNQIVIPVYAEDEKLPNEAAEKTVKGFFGSRVTYTPGKTENEGTLTLYLKNTDCEMYEQGNEVRLKSIYKPLSRSVTLDAGHGGADGGAVAYNEDGTILAKEKDFNLDVALRAQRLLEAQGVQVHMIRTEDVYVDFQRVGSIANDTGTSLFVSIHTNSALPEQANGIETFGYIGAGNVSNGMTGERLSTILLEELLEQTGAYSRGVKDGSSLAVINSTRMPATLIEIGFISNPEECAKMMTEVYRQKLAQAVCDGVMRAFDEMDI